MKVMGMAAWVCNMVKGLLHRVRAIPALAVSTGHFIHILRGVKQGCPLAPLLFVICFDVLLFKLSVTNRLDLYGFADDLALGSRSVTLLLKALKAVGEFSSFTGLRTNAAKSCVVSTRPPSASTRSRFEQAGWGEIEFKDRAVYLGMLFGPEVTTVEVFADAFAKFKKRALAFGPAMSTMSLHSRVKVCNTFLVPVLLYLAQFLIIPYREIVLPVRRICHKLCVAFNGKAFAYAHLITYSKALFGPHAPLKDVWATNMALLAAPHNLEESDGLLLPAFDEHKKITRFDGLNKSMSTSEHKIYAAFVFLEYHAPGGSGGNPKAITLKGLPKKGGKRRGWVYRIFVMNAGDIHMAREGLSKTSLPHRIARTIRQPAHIKSMEWLRGHAKFASKLTAPSVWNTQFRLTFNALPFEHRRISAKMTVPPRGLLALGHPCYLCGEGSDSLRHTYGSCTVVQSARSIVSEEAGCKLTDSIADAFLLFPPTSTPLATVLTVTFNWAVWRQRSDFFLALSEPPRLPVAARRIANYTLLHLRPEGKKESLSTLSIMALAKQPPRGDTVIFTDGSALGNPGPCGAGYSVKLPNMDTELFSTPMGEGHNNDAEMKAIAGALEKVLQHLQKGVEPGRGLLFSDSACAIGYLAAGWKLPCEKELARSTRRLYYLVKTKMKIHLLWIRGHINIEGNEIVDGLAKQAAFEARRRGV